MTEEERKAHALRIAKDALQGTYVDFSEVYEDEELAEHEEEWLAIHDLIHKVKVTVTLDN